MSILVNRQPTAKSRRPAKQRFFQIAFLIEGTGYTIGRVPCHPEVARKAFSVRKLGTEPVTYHVRLAEFGLECDCRGFVAHRHCKHCECLAAASKLFDLS